MKPIEGKGFTVPLCHICGGDGLTYTYIGPDRVEQKITCDECGGAGLAQYAVIDASTENGRVIGSMFPPKTPVEYYSRDYRGDWHGSIDAEHAMQYGWKFRIPHTLIAEKCRAREGKPVLEVIPKRGITSYSIIKYHYDWDKRYNNDNGNVSIAANAFTLGMSPETLDRFCEWFGGEG